MSFCLSCWQVFWASVLAASSKIIVCSKKNLFFRSFFGNFVWRASIDKTICLPVFLAIEKNMKTEEVYIFGNELRTAISTGFFFLNPFQKNPMTTQVLTSFAANFPATSPPTNIIYKKTIVYFPFGRQFSRRQPSKNYKLEKNIYFFRFWSPIFPPPALQKI